MWLEYEHVAQGTEALWQGGDDGVPEREGAFNCCECPVQQLASLLRSSTLCIATVLIEQQVNTYSCERFRQSSDNSRDIVGSSVIPKSADVKAHLAIVGTESLSATEIVRRDIQVSLRWQAQ